MATESKSDFNRFDRHLTAALLAPPVLWLTHLTISYVLVPTACERESNAALHLVTVVFLFLIVLSGVYSWRVLRSIGQGTTDRGAEGETRVRFMAVTGTVFGGLFALLVIASEVPNLVLRSCD